MPREKECFRDNLERIDRAFPGKEMLSVADAMSFLGMCRNTVRKYYVTGKIPYISKADLARAISSEGKGCF